MKDNMKVSRRSLVKGASAASVVTTATAVAVRPAWADEQIGPDNGGLETKIVDKDCALLVSEAQWKTNGTRNKSYDVDMVIGSPYLLVVGTFHNDSEIVAHGVKRVSDDTLGAPLHIPTTGFPGTTEPLVLGPDIQPGKHELTYTYGSRTATLRVNVIPEPKLLPDFATFVDKDDRGNTHTEHADSRIDKGTVLTLTGGQQNATPLGVGTTLTFSFGRDDGQQPEPGTPIVFSIGQDKPAKPEEEQMTGASVGGVMPHKEVRRITSTGTAKFPLSCVDLSYDQSMDIIRLEDMKGNLLLKNPLNVICNGLEG